MFSFQKPQHRTIEDFVSQVYVADGVGNCFIFTHAKDGQIHFDYFGLTPRESSSGLYNGGPDQHKIISEQQYHQVNALFDKGKLARDSQVATRTMGTSVVRRGNDSYYLGMDAKFTQELFAYLTPFKS
jgi:hypothetical protein